MTLSSDEQSVLKAFSQFEYIANRSKLTFFHVQRLTEKDLTEIKFEYKFEGKKCLYLIGAKNFDGKIYTGLMLYRGEVEIEAMGIPYLNYE